MKRIISIILGMSMVLALAGCSKKEETTKKKSKKTKVTTEESETEDSETDPTDTEETDPTTSETSDTSDTTDTTPSDTSTPAVPGASTIEHTLEDLGFYNLPTDRAYAVAYTDGSITTMTGVSEYFDDYYFDLTGYDALENALDGIYGGVAVDNDDAYDEAREKFIEDMKDGQYHLTVSRECRTLLFRADSAVTSFLLTTTTSDDEPFAPAAYNLRSENGETIGFNDVITDREAFCDFVDSYLVKAPEVNKLLSDEISDILTNIRTGKDIDFTLGFDGIFLFIEQDLYFKVPVHMLADCVNMEFFNNTPEYYTLVSDATNVIEWDVDDDNVPDKLKLEVTYDEYDAFETMTLWFNNESAKVPDDVLSELPGGVDDFYYMHASTGDFVIVNFYDEFGPGYYCFKIDGQQVSYSCAKDGHFGGFPYNPECFTFCVWTDVFGTSDFYGDFYLDATGQALLDESFVYRSFYGVNNTAVTKVDVEAVKVDISASGDQLEDVETFTLPAGTVLQYVFLDPYESRIVFSTIEENEEDEILLKLPLDYEDLPEETVIKIGGMAQTELFDGLRFAG